MENKRQFEEDDDLELPEIDQFPGYKNTRQEQVAETTDADGIPFFLKGENPEKNILKDEQNSAKDESEKEKKSDADLQIHVENLKSEKEKSVSSRIVIVLIFCVLTAVLLFAGKTVVDNFVKHPQEAPLEIVPAETSMPSASPQASADAAE